MSGITADEPTESDKEVRSIEKYQKIDYTQVALPEELLTSVVKATLPELRRFYASDEGKAYFAKWLLKYPEYAAHSTPESG